jgi:hypothetical protein
MLKAKGKENITKNLQMGRNHAVSLTTHKKVKI